MTESFKQLLRTLAGSVYLSSGSTPHQIELAGRILGIIDLMDDSEFRSQGVAHSVSGPPMQFVRKIDIAIFYDEKIDTFWACGTEGVAVEDIAEQEGEQIRWISTIIVPKIPVFYARKHPSEGEP